jgi:hypothetical protein
MKGIPFEQTINNTYSFEANIQYDSLLFIMLENSFGVSNQSGKFLIEKAYKSPLEEELTG